MSKHTPGPWKIDGQMIMASDELTWIARIPRSGFTISQDMESAANVRLIAAAPELLEALKLALLSHNMRYANGEDCWNKNDVEIIARSALAKATGCQ